MKTYKHLTLQDRIQIQTGLTQRMSFKQIAEEIGKDPSTVSKEVRKHLTAKCTAGVSSRYNPCAKRDTCNLKRVCPQPRCSHLCRNCGNCIHYCKEYEYYSCPMHEHPPYCCNGCKRKMHCPLTKKYYYAKEAQAEYESSLSESRTGVIITEEEREYLGAILEPPVLNGQSIHHVCATHGDEIMFCEKTLYNYVNAGVFNLKNIDLPPRKVRYKIRKKKKEHKVDAKCRQYRTLEDFTAFLAENNNPSVVQMDTVKGGKKGKVLLTLYFESCGFMLAFLRDNNTAKSVKDIFDCLYVTLGKETFTKLFPVILTDNGTEFSDPEQLEFDPVTGMRRTYIFYCDPNRSDQKGGIEVNHEFIRRIIPKGVSLGKFTQADISLMMSHINSYKRKKFNDLTPYELFTVLYGTDIAALLGISFIPPASVILRPELLKK